MRVLEVGLGVFRVGLRFAELIADVDVLDPAYHLAAGHAVALDQLEIDVIRPAMRLVMLTSGASIIPTTRIVLRSGGGHR